MSQSQQPTHRWKVPMGVRVLKALKGKDTPHNIAKRIGETQAAVSVTMYNFYQGGKLKREACPCGRGFIYWK